MNSKKLMMLGTIGFAAITLFGVVFTVIVSGDSTEQQLDMALSILDKGRWDIAGRMARDLEATIDLESKPEDEDSQIQQIHAAWYYIRGVSNAKSVGKDLDTPSSRRTLVEATNFLEQAQQRGFPPGFRGQGHFYLGWCYFHTYRWDDAIEQLQDSPVHWPARRSDALQMVADAHLRRETVDFEALSKSLATWRAIPGMSDSELARIRLAEAKIAFYNQDAEASESLLAGIDESLPEYFPALLWRGRWRLENALQDQIPADERSALLQEAREIFRRAKIMADTPGDIRRQATFLSGKCLRGEDNLSAALGTFSAVRQSAPQSAEAVASGIEEAEILLELENLEGALNTARNILRNIEDLELYDERWVSADELKSRLLDIGREMRDRGEFQRAIRIAEDIALAFPLSASLRLQAESLEHWAEELEASMSALPLSELSNQRQLMVDKYHAAAERYEQLSLLKLRSPEYTQILWSSVLGYQRANDLDKANELLKDYIRFEDRSKRPRGFLALGKNFMNEAKWLRALEPLERCLIEHEEHAVSYEARLLAAQAKAELDSLPEAADLLEANMYDFQLDPKNGVWRDSLFLLGQIIYRQGEQLVIDVRLNPNAEWDERRTKLEESRAKFDKAITELGNAFTRWEDDPRYYDARHLYARSHRLAAELPQQSILANPTMIDSARRKLVQERRDLLQTAQQQFKELRESITQNLDSVDSPERMNALLRNCYFGEADTLYDLGRWEEAIEAYKRVTARYLNEPESLEALVQITRCFRKLDNKQDAARTLATAQQVLRRIPPEMDGRFISVTRANRAGWDRILTSMQTWD